MIQQFTLKTSENPHTMPLFVYCKLLQEHDWTFEYSDSHEKWQLGRGQRAELERLQPAVDPGFVVWGKFAPEGMRRGVPAPQPAPAPAGWDYAGVLLGEDGKPTQHVFLADSRPAEPLSWDKARDWAASVGGRLPTVQECRLLHCNCAARLARCWHWTTHGRGWPNGSATYYSTAHGGSGERDPSEKLSALAVRCVEVSN